MSANQNKVGLAEALRQRELDEEDRESSTEGGDEWAAGPDSPKKTATPARRLARPGEKAATPPAPPATRPTTSSSSVTKPQPTGAIASEKRPQSELGRACDAYDVDLSATEFNMCKCGFKKADHVQSAAFRAAPKPIGSIYHPDTKPVEKKPVVVPHTTPVAAPAVAADEPESEGPQACDAFEVDLQAKEFGTCKCGFKKAAHSKSALLAKPKSTGSGFSSVQNAERQAQEEKKKEAEEAKRKAEEEARAHQEYLERERKIREQEEAAAVHGEAAPEEHATHATISKAEEPAEEEGPKACDAFEIDLNAPEFGTCKCGHKKTEHSKAALFNKPLPKPFHAAAPLSVPAVKSHNRPPPAFATTAAAPPAPKAPPAREPEPEPVHEEAPIEEAAAEEPAKEVEAPTETAETPAEHEEQPAGEEAAAQTTVLDPPELYVALYDFEGQEVEDLSFKTDEIIEVFEILDADWLRGRVQGKDMTGVFPANYAQKLTTEEEAEVEAEEAVAATEEKPSASEPAAEEETPAASVEEEEVAPVEEAPVEETPAAAVEEEQAAEVEPEPEPVQEVAEPEPIQEEEVAAVEEETPVEEAPSAAEEPPATVEEPMMEEEPLPEEEIVAAESEAPFTAYALFDFPGESEDDLSFKTGDVIEVIGIVDSQWWRGVLNGHEGIFPAEFVSRDAPAAAPEANADAAAGESAPAAEEAGTVGSLGYVTALYDMEAQNDGDLPFKVDDRIDIVEIIDDDWYRGSLNGVEGLVPRNYVSELQN